MLDKVDATSVCRQISTDHAATFSPEINRKLCLVFSRKLLKSLQDAASLGTQNPVVLIEAYNLVHGTQAQNNLIEHGHTASHKACIATLGYDSQLALIAVA
jgi:uncharacterized protein with PIN domain